MKNKIIIFCSLVVILAFGFLYIQNNNLIADDKDGKKNCSSSCTQKTNTSSAESKSGCQYDKTGATTDATKDVTNEYAVYEFVTDKISCDDCKPGMSENLMGLAGVKEINFGETCKVSKMTSVKVFYSSTDTTPEVIAASVKDKGLECVKDAKCTSKNKVEKKL